MFNYCVLSGFVISEPALKFYSKEHPLTEFKMDILWGNRFAGRITVFCHNSQAMRAVKYVSKGLVVIVSGEISIDAWPDEGGAWREIIILHAYEIEVVDREILSLEHESLHIDS